MKKNRFVLGGCLLASTLAFAQQPPAQPPAQPLSFFVTSVGLGKGADLGGLAGADAHCAHLAQAAGSPKKVWRAYLSTQAADGQPAINARDRIGNGPWYNVRGAAVAKDVAHLHGDTPNEHDILTGSQPDGRAFADAADHTCKNYTSSAEEGSAQVGHFDRTGGGNTSWNSAHPSRGCSQEKLKSSGGAGLFYCFAAD